MGASGSQKVEFEVKRRNVSESPSRLDGVIAYKLDPRECVKMNPAACRKSTRCRYHEETRKCLPLLDRTYYLISREEGPSYSKRSKSSELYERSKDLQVVINLHKWCLKVFHQTKIFHMFPGIIRFKTYRERTLSWSLDLHCNRKQAEVPNMVSTSLPPYFSFFLLAHNCFFNSTTFAEERLGPEDSSHQIFSYLVKESLGNWSCFIDDSNQLTNQQKISSRADLVMRDVSRLFNHLNLQDQQVKPVSFEGFFLNNFSRSQGGGVCSWSGCITLIATALLAEMTGKKAEDGMSLIAMMLEACALWREPQQLEVLMDHILDQKSMPGLAEVMRQSVPT